MIEDDLLPQFRNMPKKRLVFMCLIFITLQYPSQTPNKSILILASS